jgi:hypothetical protein
MTGKKCCAASAAKLSGMFAKLSWKLLRLQCGAKHNAEATSEGLLEESMLNLEGCAPSKTCANFAMFTLRRAAMQNVRQLGNAECISVWHLQADKKGRKSMIMMSYGTKKTTHMQNKEMHIGKATISA